MDAKRAAGVLLMLNLTACGTIMHPERKGQKDGRIDAGIAILDGLGLLFFIIPGVIAYAVDFSNGTIYLPKGQGKTSMRLEDLKEVSFDPDHCGTACLEGILKAQTGREIQLDRKDLKVRRLHSTEEMLARFTQAEHDAAR